MLPRTNLIAARPEAALRGQWPAFPEPARCPLLQSSACQCQSHSPNAACQIENGSASLAGLCEIELDIPIQHGAGAAPLAQFVELDTGSTVMIVLRQFHDPSSVGRLSIGENFSQTKSRDASDWSANRKCMCPGPAEKAAL